MASRTITVEIVGDASSLNKAFRQASGSAQGFGARIGKFAKAGALGLGAAGVGGALAVLKTGFEEVGESQKVMAQTEAVLKSTGGAAKVSAKQVEDLAGSLSKMSGVDDEAIQSGQNLLLTFTKVRNEAGRGKDIFTQATKATLDMSVAMGTDMSSASIQVGKALQDPIKGVSALQRVGVSFTAAQKEQIAALVASGKTMDAQKLILKELETQFGGSAKAAGETLPGQFAKAKLAFEEVSGRIVQKLIPTITKMLTGFEDFLAWLDTNWPQFEATIKAGMDKVKTVVDAIKPILDTFVDTFKGLITIIQGLVKGDWGMVWDGIKQVVVSVFDRIKEVLKLTVTIWKTLLTNIGEAAVGGLKAGLSALGDVAKSALDAALVPVRAFRDAAKAAFVAVKDGVLTAFAEILGGISGFLGGLASMVEAVAKVPGIGGKFKGLADAVRGAQTKVEDLRDSINNLKSKDITITVHEKHFRSFTDLESARGKRAHGGPVTAGGAFTVGEHGPEVFVPNRSGTIIPNGGPARSRAGGSLNVTVNVHGSVVTEGQLVEAIHRGLLRKAGRNVSLGLA